jgi:hypothetical protein
MRAYAEGLAAVKRTATAACERHLWSFSTVDVSIFQSATPYYM